MKALPAWARSPAACRTHRRCALSYEQGNDDAAQRRSLLSAERTASQLTEAARVARNLEREKVARF